MKFISFVLRFFKYLKWCKQGGYTQLTLSQIQYPEILKGKKVIITGGSEGIGLAMAKKFVDVGAVATFLCSDVSNGIIGQTIVCDGGALL